MAKLLLFNESDKVGGKIDNPTYNGIFTGNSSSNLCNLYIRNLVSDKLYQARVQSDYEINSGAVVVFGGEFQRDRVNIDGEVPEDENDLSPGSPKEKVDTDYKSDEFSLIMDLRTDSCIFRLWES
jgi:hypothetical protein